MSVLLEGPMRRTEVMRRPVAQLLQLLRFLMVGGSGAVVFAVLSSFAIGLNSGLPNWQVSSLCYAAMIVPVYLAHRRFSFRSSTPHGTALPRYVAVQLNAICLAALFSYVFYHVVGVPTPFAALLVAGLTAGVNFVILRLWAFASAF